MAQYLTPESKKVATNVYSDIDITFAAHPVTGDITIRKDADAVKRAVRNIILTNKYERPFKPNFGGNVRSMLFELDTTRRQNRFKRELADQIETFEPRVENVFVDLKMEDNDLYITVFYSIINGIRNQEVQFTVTRAR